jgi:hypothetical protein
MTGVPKYASQQVALCCICGRPIPLEMATTDENGKAVHEECYAGHTISRFRNSSYPTLTRRLASREASGRRIQIIFP